MPTSRRKAAKLRRKRKELERMRQVKKVTNRLTKDKVHFQPMLEVPEDCLEFLKLLRENTERLIGAKIGVAV